MTNLQGFDGAISPMRGSKLDNNFWSAAMEAHQAGRWKDAFVNTLNYVDPTLLNRTGNATQTEFNMPHGSMMIKLSLSDTHYSFSAPFLRLPEKNVLPVMRQLAEINFNRLTVTQIVLNGNDLTFQFTSPIEGSNPYKIYYTLQEICWEGDYFDDIFVDKFGATRLQEPKVEKYSPAQVEDGFKKFQGYLTEMMNYVSHYDGINSPDFSWYSMAIGYYKIFYVLDLQGTLLAELQKGYNSLFGEAPIEERTKAAKAIFQKVLSGTDKAKFEASFYEPYFVISPRTRIQGPQLAEKLKQHVETAQRELQNGYDNWCAFYLTYYVYNMFYEHDMGPGEAAMLTGALVAGAGKPWKEATNTMIMVLNGFIMSQQVAQN